MCLVGFMGYISYLFYTTSELTKTPPHEMNGYLLLSDYIAKYMVASLFIVAIPRVPKPGRSRQLENTVRKLGRDARLEIAKRTYVGDVRQPMDKPPNVDYTGRMGKVQEWWDTQKRKWPAYNRWKLRLFHMQNAFIIGAKYSIPVFDNLYFGWTDIFYGQRFLATMVLIGFMIMTCLGLGIWAGQKLVKTLTEYYSYYNFLFAFEKVADPSTAIAASSECFTD
ncbi:hypothetical protein T484DRAFT_1806652 [Baffinella frigidus]|nr:hypothetical protein T484DRAFT_1806652 [Cryptophyta sp. CCMP2293]